MTDEPSPQLIAAAIGMLICAATLGIIALRASMSADFDVYDHMRDEQHHKNLPGRLKKFKLVQRVLIVLGMVCFCGVAWALTVFLEAAQPGEDPESMSVAIFSSGFGFFGFWICVYQSIRMGYRRKAINRLIVDGRKKEA